jgi:hypothetical protein
VVFVVIALLAALASVSAVQKRELDMCTVCTGVVSDLKSRLSAGDSVATALAQMVDSGCTAFGVNQPEVRVDSASHHHASALHSKSAEEKREKKSKKSYFSLFSA